MANETNIQTYATRCLRPARTRPPAKAPAGGGWNSFDFLVLSNGVSLINAGNAPDGRSGTGKCNLHILARTVRAVLLRQGAY